jgi:hypothetical protein
VLISFAERVGRSARLRHFLFLSASLLAIVLVGYHFGTLDQAVHIPYLKKSVDPTLYPGDQFLDLRAVHYSFFWYLFRPVYRLGILEPVMFAVHVLATYLTFWMGWKLSITLFKDPLAALIGVASFIGPHVSMAGFPIIEYSLLNRSFVLPFLLLAITLYLQRRYWHSFLLMGVLYNLHVLSVGYVMAMIAVDVLLRWREIGRRNILISAGVFLVGTLPVHVWKISHSGFDLSLRPEILDVAARGTMSTIYYVFATQPQVITSLVCGIGTVALFVISLRAAPQGEHDRVFVHFFYAVGLIVLIENIAVYLLPVTLILQLQILRAAFFMLPFSYLYFSNTIARSLRQGSLKGGAASIVLGTFIAMPFPFVPAVVWAVRKWLDRMRWRKIAAAAALIVLLVVIMVGAIRVDMWRPGIYLYGPHTPWVDVQKWAREHTPVDALFIAPPHLFWTYTPGWRVFSERSTVVTITELMETPFEPAYLDEWVARFNDVAPGAIDRFNYNADHALEVTGEAYNSLSDADIERLAQKYGVSYLVVEKPHLHDFPVVYENEGFVVYDLRQISR